jgi:RNA polymerase-binding transcription factor DksA
VKYVWRKGHECAAIHTADNRFCGLNSRPNYLPQKAGCPGYLTGPHRAGLARNPAFPRRVGELGSATLAKDCDASHHGESYGSEEVFMSQVIEATGNIHQAPRKIKGEISDHSEQDTFIQQTLVQRIAQNIEIETRETKRLCEICNQPIPTGRIKGYPNVTRCIPCQRLVENPALLRSEIARLHHTLVFMENQYDAVENLEMAEKEKLVSWHSTICCFREVLSKLRAALYGADYGMNG